MSDQLYLSLWFPNFRVQALPEKLTAVLQTFAKVGGLPRVASAAVRPISWHEVATYERVYVLDDRSDSADDSLIPNAVADATHSLADDTAYEFELRWPLWQPQTGEGLDLLWRQQPATVRIIGFGPDFDDAAYESNGHIRVDFGLDSPFLLEDVELSPDAAARVQQNVEKLLAFTLSVEKHCGISSRLLWTESGESIAQKLIDRLQRLQ
jgi:hypothetical protein